MLRKDIEIVPESNGPVHQQDEFGSGQPTLVGPFRKIEEIWDRTIDEIMILLGQHLTSLEPDARQSRLAMETDGPANTKTPESTEGAATVAQAMHGDSFSACQVEPGPKTNSTCFGVMAEASNPPFRDDVLVENDAASPKSCLPSLEMRTTTETCTATKITFTEPPFRFYSTEETNPKETNSICLVRPQFLEI